jgi:signal transduction histidine kinase/CheY-like chemotaxis protein
VRGPSRTMGRWSLMPAIAVLAAVMVAAAGVVSALYSDQLYRVQQTRQVDAQAQILAGSVAAALAFDDSRVAQEYVNALKPNADIEAAGVYDPAGRLVAHYGRNGASVPTNLTQAERPAFRDGRLTTIEPVVQGDTRLGLVYLRTVIEPPARRLSRYSAVALLAVMAMLVVAVLGQAQSALHRANQDLARGNEALRFEIAEREKAEEALVQSQKMEAIGQITGGVAHDFNNILMVASSGLDLLDRTNDAGRRARLTEGIRQAVKRGADLTRQLLAFARRTALRPEVIDLAAQMEGMRVLLDRSLREDIQIVMDLQPVWPVEVDPGQLELGVLNIAVNARDAMPQAGVITIATRNVPAMDSGGLVGDFVQLSISDQGAGMAPETLARAIEPFFTTKEVGKGTGLGLSQIYGFASASGGDLRIVSALGEGATISIYLPRSHKALTAPDAPAPPPAKGQAKGRVLLVEDDPAVGVLVCEMLSELGYDCVRAGDADEALLRLAGSDQIDLVFTDMVMPGPMNGIELAREIARLRPGLPIVLTTGFSPAAQAATQEGLPLLSKPYTIDALAAALSKATDRARGAA